LSLALALLFATPVVRAESRPEALAPLRVDASLERNYRRAHIKRNLGIALAIPGVVCTLLGVLLLSYAGLEEPHFGAEEDEIGSGAVIAAFGLALSAPGVYFWMSGQDEMDMVKWRRQQMAPPRTSLLRITF
jgi:hypothetical protein